MHKPILFLLSMALLLSLLSVQRVRAQDSIAPEPDSGAVVCPPVIYFSPPGDCAVLGPSAYLTALARTGLTFPLRPLPASKPDFGLTQLPFHYFHLKDGAAVQIYSAPGQTGPGGQQFLPGFVYVSYVDVDTTSGVYYLLQNGGWIPGNGNRVSEISAFQGLEFKQTPRNSFGWAFEQIPVKNGPGQNAPNTGAQIYPFEVVQIFGTQSVDNAEWNMIGADQWVEARKVAQVVVNTTASDGVTTGRWIDVNLAEQTLAVYDQNRLVFATVIATGLEPFWTRPGLFQIQQKKETETMRNNDPSDFYYLDNVPWTMYFDGARALHGAYWRTRFGYPQSHGCVNLSVGDAHWLFNWAQQGDWVYVHDPSGLTPTDPALYTGGAY
ncbi:MAG TPA: L,D-transpeptidase [Anaerolineales bacterium]|jgi:lipoprotein-anchoring transpeptidase ErfK/SrfK